MKLCRYAILFDWEETPFLRISEGILSSDPITGKTRISILLADLILITY